jgi:hypothetical protein
MYVTNVHFLTCVIYATASTNTAAIKNNSGCLKKLRIKDKCLLLQQVLQIFVKCWEGFSVEYDWEWCEVQNKWLLHIVEMGLEVRTVCSHLKIIKTLFQTFQIFHGCQTCLAMFWQGQFFTQHLPSRIWCHIPWVASHTKFQETHFRMQLRQQPSSFGGLRVSMLASGTQDRGVTPDRSRRIFPAGKIHSMPSFGGEVK